MKPVGVNRDLVGRNITIRTLSLFLSLSVSGMQDMMSSTTLEWFGEKYPANTVPLLSVIGATTYRLRHRGITIFLDTWLEKPSILPHYLSIDDVEEADYIFISHAHFDQYVSYYYNFQTNYSSLSGADRLAIRTGAIVVANCEAIGLLQKAGVPDHQLFPVAGGERIPLFTKNVIEQARNGDIPTASGFPGQPALPDHTFATFSVHVWPSLHAFVPNPHPDEMDTGVVYTGEANPYMCTLDITRGMRYGLLRLGQICPPEQINDGMRSFIEYVEDKRNVFSHCDGGQLMYNFIFNDTALLWSAHLGAYDGVLTAVRPQPKIAILGIAGRANLNGRPFDGSAADFAVKQAKLLGEPEKVIWSLHDDR